MRRSLVARVVVWGMVLSLPAATFAADVNSAMLRVHGKVTVNGSELRHERAIFAGDTVASGERATATLTAAGSSVQLQPNSTLVFGSDSVTVRDGGARISTSRGMTARVDNVTVAPAAAAADYSVNRTGADLQITASRSSLTISDGTRSMTINPGQALSIKSPRAAAPQGGAEGGLSGLQWAIIAAVAVVSTVTVVATTQEDDSPSAP